MLPMQCMMQHDICCPRKVWTLIASCVVVTWYILECDLIPVTLRNMLLS